MNVRKAMPGAGTEEEFEAAIRTLANTIREAGECMLELQQALELLRLASEPKLALAVELETMTCLRRAMRRARR